MQRTGIVISLIGIIFFTGCGGGGGISEATMESGKKVYQTYCQSCHMEDGAGVPGMNSPLIGSKYATGDNEKLISIVLHGSAAFANDPGRTYRNVMPSLANLTDQEIADVLTYIRNSFNNKGSAIAPEDVKLVREKKN
jgi:mono/diheme cytochrome c family protein